MRPAQVFHPVEIIIDELNAREWTLDDLTMHSSPTDPAEWGVRRLAWDLYFAGAPSHPECRLGEMGVWLERAFGISSKLWEAMHELWRTADESQRSYPPDVEAWLSERANIPLQESTP